MTGSRPEDLVTPADAVRIFGVSRDQLSLWESQRRLRSLRTLTGLHYRLSEITPLVNELRAATEASIAEDAERRAVLEAVPPKPRPTRHAARRRALEVLHAADVAGPDAAFVLDDDMPDYARALVEGVRAEQDAIDAAIAGRAEHWSIDRMPVVDRNVLRIGVYELLHTDVPAGVVVDEAVILAKLLSTEESGRFVNGLLGRVARDVRPAR